MAKVKEYRVQVTVFCTVLAESEEDAGEQADNDLCGMEYGGTKITGVGNIDDVGLASKCGW